MATHDDIREIVRQEVREVVGELLQPIKDTVATIPRLLYRVRPFLSSQRLRETIDCYTGSELDFGLWIGTPIQHHPIHICRG